MEVDLGQYALDAQKIRPWSSSVCAGEAMVQDKNRRQVRAHAEKGERRAKGYVSDVVEFRVQTYYIWVEILFSLQELKHICRDGLAGS